MKKIHAGLWISLSLSIIPLNQAVAEDDLSVVSSVETNYIGLAVGMAPDYMGSEDYQAIVLPYFRYEFGDHRNIELQGNYLSANLIDSSTISFGPALRYRAGRDDDIENDTVALLPEIDSAVELGATLSSTWVLYNDPRNRASIGIDVMGDVSDTSDGYNSTLFAKYWMPAGDRVDVGISGNMFFADEDFNNTYFGVTPGGSAVSGLPTYAADSGMSSFSITPMATYKIDDNWRLAGGLRYQMLMGDPADSPVVADENQLIGLVGVIYSWGMGVN